MGYTNLLFHDLYKSVQIYSYVYNYMHVVYIGINIQEVIEDQARLADIVLDVEN